MWLQANGDTIFEENKTEEIIPDTQLMEENEDYHQMDSEIDFETCSEEQNQGENFRTKYIIPTAENVEEFKRWLKVEKKIKVSNQEAYVKNIVWVLKHLDENKQIGEFLGQIKDEQSEITYERKKRALEYYNEFWKISRGQLLWEDI